MRYLTEQSAFEIRPHSRHRRLYQVTVSREAVEEFLAGHQEVNAQILTYVPFMRFMMAHELDGILGKAFTEAINGILRERETGGFTLHLPDGFEGMDSFVKWGTAITHLLGIPNFDAMSGNYYACFTVVDADSSDSLLRQAYRPLTMHTDGTFVNQTTDWLLMMKMEESNAAGGRSRLLHLDDWEDLERFASDPLSAARITYKGPPSKNVEESMIRQTFDRRDGETYISFIDQFAYPRSREVAHYLYELSRSLESSKAVSPIALPVGGLVVINNGFWLHGREPFEKHPELHRVLMRQRGAFYAKA